MIEDRQYQTDIIAEFLRTTAQYKRIILVAPTGSGKTIIAGQIIKYYNRLHWPVLVLAHRREIIQQTSEKLRNLGISHGIIMDGFPYMPSVGAGRFGPNLVGASHSH